VVVPSTVVPVVVAVARDVADDVEETASVGPGTVVASSPARHPAINNNNTTPNLRVTPQP
jgi:hypothetical protein